MSANMLSEQEIRRQLSTRYSEEQIDTIIDQYTAATLKETPDKEIIDRLAQKNQEDKFLTVRFKLTTEQYDALTTYFGESQQPGTSLVQKVLDEFIQLIAS